MAAVRTVLPEAAKPIFDAQVAAITRVQRLPPSWAEISFYRIKWGRVDWSDVPAFPCTDEFRLAKVRFKVRGRRYTATLTSIAGHIFDFTITPGPKGIANLTWEGEASAALLDDPLRAPTGVRTRETLPALWLQFIEQQRGQRFPDWTLYDASTAYRVALDDGEYLVLAERSGDRFVLSRSEPAGSRLFYLDSHDGIPQSIAGRLEDLMGSGG